MERRSPTRAPGPANLTPPASPGAAVRLRATLEALILALLAALLGRRRARAWHHAPAPYLEEWPLPLPLPDSRPPPPIRSIHDGTHLVCEHPILYVIGPGPNRGLRPRPRAMPLPLAQVARAPPRPKIPPHTPIRAETPPARRRSPMP
jgi:hypothetical protein